MRIFVASDPAPAERARIGDGYRARRLGRAMP